MITSISREMAPGSERMNSKDAEMRKIKQDLNRVLVLVLIVEKSALNDPIVVCNRVTTIRPVCHTFLSRRL
jgi:hypothetical protein